MIIAGSVVVVVEIVVITVVVNIIVHCYCHHYYNLVHIHFTVLQLFGAPLLGSLPKYIYRRSLLFTYHSFREHEGRGPIVESLLRAGFISVLHDGGPKS